MTPDDEKPWSPDANRSAWFGGYRFQRLRRIPKYRTGAVAPKWMQDWRTLKEAGESFRSIALGTGWTPTRKKQPRGSFSPSAIRQAFKDWGWNTNVHGNGAKPKAGRNSLLVRVARLETELRDLRAVLRHHVNGD